jgi:hypothetical protein
LRSNGQDGAPAGAVYVWIRLEPGTKPLLQIKVTSGARQSLYVVDCNGGSLRVTANGGAGGRAGEGGRGGRGGSGGSGFPSGFSGLDGRPGWDAHLGAGGAAGTITESVDPAAQPFMNCISLSNHSGLGAPGPTHLGGLLTGGLLATGLFLFHRFLVPRIASRSL